MTMPPDSRRPSLPGSTPSAADSPFGPAAQKLKEHYGVALPVSPIRRIAEGTAAAIFEQHELEAVWPQRAGQDGFSPTGIGETPCQHWARWQFWISRGWLHRDLQQAQYLFLLWC